MKTVNKCRSYDTARKITDTNENNYKFEHFRPVEETDFTHKTTNVMDVSSNKFFSILL